MKLPHGWHIQYNPKPIPLRGHDWDYWHDEVDNDSRLTGTAASEEAAKLAIMEKQAERYDFDKDADTPDDDDMHINIESLQYIIADMQRDLMERDKRIAQLEAVAEAAVCWWEMHRPKEFSAAQHLQNPRINTSRGSSGHLATVVAQYLSAAGIGGGE